MRKFLLAALMSLALIPPAYADSLLLRDVNFVDVENKKIVKRNLFILDGKITPESKKGKETFRTLDMSGKYVIPGLIELHVHCGGNPFPDGAYEHLGPQETAKRMLYCGVVAYLDLFYTDFAKIFEARNLQRTESFKHREEADIYAAGTGWGDWNLTKDPQLAVTQYIEHWKPDVIKLIYGRDSCTKANLVKAIKGANLKGVKTVVHIGSWEHAQDAIEGHATCVTHFFDDEVIPNSVLNVWAKSKTLSIPTMAAQCDVYNLSTKPILLKSPLLNGMEKSSQLSTYLHPKKFSKKTAETFKWQKDDVANDMNTLTKMYRAHIPMLAGSDTGNEGTVQGFSTHREIKMFRDGGMSTWDALASATTKAASFLKRPSGVKEGEEAELVILNANPIADISNTQKIDSVIHHGNMINRSALIVNASTTEAKKK